MKIPKDLINDYLSWTERQRFEYWLEIMADLFRIKESSIHEYHKIKKKKLGIK